MSSLGKHWKLSVETRKKMSLSKIGKQRYDLKGEKSHTWKGGITYKKDYQKEYLRNLRKSAIAALGNKCNRCDFSDYRALQIDHVNGGGSKERKERDYRGSFHKHVIESVLKKENKYQLLCANCNWIKRFENNE